MESQKYPKRISEAAKCEAVIQKDNDASFKKVYIDNFIGFGVFASRAISSGEPILKYRGDYVDRKEADKRQGLYSLENIRGSYVYEINCKLCVDATQTNGLAKFVNHSPDKFANCKMKKKVINEKIHLILYTVKEVEVGDEIRYDYGYIPEWEEKEEYNKPFHLPVDENVVCKTNEKEVENPTKRQKKDMKRREKVDIGQQVSSNSDREEYNIQSKKVIENKTQEIHVTIDEEQNEIVACKTNEEEVENPTKRQKKDLKRREKVDMGQEICSNSDREEFNIQSKKVVEKKTQEIHVTIDEDQNETIVCKTNEEEVENPTKRQKKDLKRREKVDIGQEVSLESGRNQWKLSRFVKKASTPDTVKYKRKTSTPCASEWKKKIRNEDFEELLEPSKTIANDSGLHGDFPSVINTTKENDSDHNENAGLLYRKHKNIGKRLKIDYHFNEDETSSEDDDVLDDDYDPNDDREEDEDNEEYEDDVIEEKESLKKKRRKGNSLKEKETNDQKSASCVEKYADEELERTIKKIQTKIKKKEDKSNKMKTISKEQDPFTFGTDSEVEEEEPDEGVYIPLVRKSVEGLRIYDKTHCCLYCQKMDPKMGRHLQRDHYTEEKVREIMQYDKDKDKQKRKLLFDALRQKGDFYHNAKVLKTGGMLIVKRRPAGGVVGVNDYAPCKYCLVYILRRELSRHCNTCPFKKIAEVENDTAIQKQCDLILYPNIDTPGCTLELQEFVLRKMQKDAITSLIRDDMLILSFGSFLLSGKGEKHSHYIAQNMRILARLVIKLREYQKNMAHKFLLDFLKPQFFDTIICATKELAGYSMTNKDGLRIPGFKIPSFPLKVGYALNNVASLLQGIGLRNKDEELEKEGLNFQKLYSTEWSIRINAPSIRTLAERKFDRVEYLPLTDDLLKVRDYCEGQIVTLTEQLLRSASLQSWRALAEVVITRLTIFNKRRGNEVSSLLIKKFNDRKENHTVHNAIGEGLTPLEEKLCQRMDLCYVRGKRGRQVPIIMPPSVLPAIEVLLKTRSAVGVSHENIYVFAAPTRGSLNALRGYHCLSTVVKSLPNLEKPQYIRSTTLRKYIATVAQVVDLRGNELEWLANHLGHNLDVHKEYYRLRDSNVELAKVSKLLLAVDAGKGKELVGKRFEDIDIQDIPLDLDEAESEEDENCGDEEEDARGNVDFCEIESGAHQEKNGSIKKKENNVETADNENELKRPRKEKEIEKETSGLEEPPKKVKMKKTWKAWSKDQTKVILEELHE